MAKFRCASYWNALTKYSNIYLSQFLHFVPLPVPAEIDARLAPHRQRYHAIDLDAVRVPPMILAPRRFLREPYQVRAGEMMMVANLGPPHAAEKRFGVVAMDAVAEAIRFLMVDPVHREAAAQSVPRTAFVGINFGALGDPGTDEVERRDFGGEHAGKRLAVPLADHHHDLALA